ncbi:MAG: CatA-like O-acetyltransferase [Thermodesulfobacteriota bacterium]
MSDITLPEIGEGIEEASIINIFVSPGDAIKKEQSVVEIETDKAALELPSPFDGTISEIVVSVGDVIKIGQLIAKVNGGGAAAKEKPAEKKEAKKEEVKKEEQTEEKAVEEIKDTKKDVKEIVEEKKEEAPDEKIAEEPDNVVQMQSKAQETTTPQTTAKDEDKVSAPASPSTRKLARELGLDINKVPGTEPGGRISSDDVIKFAKQLIISCEATADTHRGTYQPNLPALPDFTKWGEIERKKMNTVRRLTAENLSMAWTIPHVTQHDKADITELDLLRKENKQKAKDAGGNLTITPILIKIVASALKVFPEFNASVDMENTEIIYKKYVNIGFAVDTERGLFVPNIQNADKKNIIEIAKELSDISERTRNKKVTPDELKGSTFTVSNLGGIGGTYFSPIIYYPDVAILGVSQSIIEPVYENGKFEPKLMMPLSLSYDHRIIDGASAARFLRWLVKAVEEPFKILFEGH